MFEKNAINLNFHDLLHYSSTLSLKFNLIGFMICLTTKTNEKKSEIIGVSSWPPLNPDHKSLDYAIWSVLEIKTNATSHRNIGSLKTVIGEEMNKMSEEFILKACKSFQRHLDTIIEKN